ncbi:MULTISPECIES: dienelactone hydrolase family protein [Francisella]|uniref:Carboxylesterase n=1 Tax=Francisella opportunistica TaxID=2016517 RepID=A0A345JPC9_9GAMM|nr:MULTISPECIES: dienelactone hydrolase family protein [Francisella]APC90839.1 Carboxylesterase/phospholipase family protein [Francisella sp. MA067296]AXH29175.1 carboxylesterase [Francisella opportunistica]AXH30826.1 carboxylesterase [Francisella opportunistica]AXH32471.1 carboxylesterase [Francisella opportunistica]
MNYELIEPVDQAKFCVIWLHGLGADGHDFVDIVNYFDVSLANIRFIFPHADVLAVTINMGMQMPAWYDIKSLDANSLNRIVDVDGINTSIKKLNKLIDKQVNQGIPSENIILAGFSQGGVIATYTAITSQRKLGGFIALSTYLPAWDNFKDKITSINKGLPILVCHGTDDHVLPQALGQDLSAKLTANGFINQYRHYVGMQHSVCMEEIKDISDFIAKTFKI